MRKSPPRRFQFLRYLISDPFHRIHKFPDLLPGDAVDMHAARAHRHNTARTADLFRQHPAQHLIFVAGTVPNRRCRTPASIPGQRFPRHCLHNASNVRFFPTGKADLKVLSDAQYCYFDRTSCGHSLFRQHPFHLRYSFTSTPNGDSSFAARCVTISSIDSGF